MEGQIQDKPQFVILELVERLVGEASGSGLDFLIIDGYAVVHHGYPRMTFDIDFLGRDSQRADWISLVRAYHYEPYTKTSAFMQVSSQTVG